MPTRFLVTGGAGFVGCNLVNNLLREGFEVVVVDSLARRGSESNLAWLRDRGHGSRLKVVIADVRDFEAVSAAAREVDVIYHLAAQVAVTSSVEDPRRDFEVNALGTFNVLEAARLSGGRPIIVIASTNKVYGAMKDVEVVETETRYAYRDYPYGVSESQALDFYSPYGCSKGAADQYVHDYDRIYDLPSVVFRMSCIYGPRQFGNEDQGWVAHFIISAARGTPITIYGDGKQVRDVLYVDDLVRAFRLAAQKIDVARGQVFNIGGGPSNTVSVWREFGQFLEEAKDGSISVGFDAWRPGDQPCYVSDIRKASRVLGWQPQIDKATGFRRLWGWVTSHHNAFGDLQAGHQLVPPS
jgi:CDP-paratose 2-epimerase